MNLKLKAPRSVLETEGAKVDDVLRRHRDTALSLSKEKITRLEKCIRERIEEWEANTDGLRSKLTELRDFFDGKDESIDFPFGEGDSSNIDIRYAVAQARTLRAGFIRTVFESNEIVSAKLGPGAVRTANINEIEAATNWAITEDSNGAEVLKETPAMIFRDGTALVYGEWERRVERGVDTKTYVDITEFESDYPDPEAAGLSESEYAKALAHIDGYENELNVIYDFDFVAANGLNFTVFPLAKFIWFPLYAQKMQDLDLYGFYYRQSSARFEHLGKQKYYSEDGVEKARKKNGETHRFDDFDAGSDRSEGINSESQSGVSYQLAKLVVCDDLDDDSIQERYRVIWDLDTNTILRVERYDIRRNIPNIVPFRFVKKNGRFLGDSILKDCLPLYQELNALHRHRSNVRRLTDSVTMIMPENLKESVDLGAEYAWFRPGMTLWVPDQYMTSDKRPAQLQIYNTSKSGDSMDEESLVMRYIDMSNGISQGQSGRETAQDPDAPASKTRMLLQRADLRGDDYIVEWSASIPDFVDLARALIYQNAGSQLSYSTRSKGEFAQKEIETGILIDSGVKFSLKSGRQESVPETEMNKVAALMAGAIKFGVAQMKPSILKDGWNRYVLASRVPDPDVFMVESDEEAMQMSQLMFGPGNQGGANAGATGIAGGGQGAATLPGANPAG